MESSKARRTRCKQGPRARITALAAALLFAASPRSARADDAAAAEALFLEAKELIAQKKYAEACPKLEASYRLDRGVGTLMNLADCHENVGRIATAWGEWGSAHDWLTRDGDKRARYAAQRRDALTPRLSKLQITVTSVAPSLDVYRGSTKIDPGAYNVALPVDPGAHVVSVRLGDVVLKEERVDLAESASASITLDLEAIKRTAPPPPDKPVLDPSVGASQRGAGIAIGSIGIAAIVVAGSLEILALSNVARAKEPDSCINNFCSPNGFETIREAGTFAEAGQWVGIGGIALAGLGLTLLLTAPSQSPGSPSPPAKAGASPKRSPQSARITPWAAPGAGGVMLTGRLW